jgi:hypothetical protein
VRLNRVVVTAAALALGVACAGAADAAIILTTVTGTVTLGFDRGTFLLGSAAGQDFTAVFRTDDTIPSHIPEVGGDQYSGPGNTTASLTINGVTQTISGNFDSYVYVCQPVDCGGSWADGAGSTDRDQLNILLTATHSLSFAIISPNNAFAPADLHTAYSYTVQPGDTVRGSAEYVVSESDNGFTQTNYSLTLAPTSVTSTILSGVPEPAAWGLLIVGLAATGLMLRRAGPQRLRIA